MAERTSYPPGTFSWVDLQTTDPDAAKSFYGDLLGWTYEDMTDTVPKWDLSQFAAFGSGAFCTGANPFTCTWQQVEAFFSSFPTHQVENEVLVDDSQSFFAADSGCAYFDLVSAGARTYVRHDDANDSGDLPNAC